MLYRNGRPVMRGIGDTVPLQVVNDAIAQAEAAAALAARSSTRSAAVPSSTPAATQQSLCSAAAQAFARGNPAAPGLAQLCLQQREQNIAAGHLEVDAMTLNDAATRVALMNAGRAILAREPRLASAASASGNERTFAIGVAVARGGSAQYAAGVRAGLSASDVGGFDAGIRAASPTQQAGNGGGGDSSEGVPRAVLIGGGVVGVLAIAAVAYKLTRRR